MRALTGLLEQLVLLDDAGNSRGDAATDSGEEAHQTPGAAKSGRAPGG